MKSKQEAILDAYLSRAYIDLSPPRLYEEIIRNREGYLTVDGAIAVRTSDYNALPSTAKYIVDGNAGIHAIDSEHTEALLQRLLAYLCNRGLYVQNCLLGHDPNYRQSVRIITETAWHSLYVRNKYLPAPQQQSSPPAFSVLHVPGFRAISDLDSINSNAFVILDISRRLVFICGTAYAGEIRRAVFTMLSYILPEKEVLTVRCSANMGNSGDIAVFLGREGTGKTTLAVSPGRKLVGDHFMGWSEQGLFNLENGGDAKCLQLDPHEEPEIFGCTQKFGTILENIAVDPVSGCIDLADSSLTENTRVIYSHSHIPDVVGEGICKHPQNIFLLTCDAFGVLPPLARLTSELAVYAFLSSYTSHFRQAEPGYMKHEVKFDMCFEEPLLAQPFPHYGKVFWNKIQEHKIQCWVVNTGWSGEPYGKSDRIKIAYSRALIEAAISGKLQDVTYEKDPIFHFDIPTTCPGVPSQILVPRHAAADEGEYEARANHLAQEFMQNFAQFEKHIPENMRAIMANIITLGEDALNLENFGLSI